MIICQQTRGLLSSNDQLSLDLPFAATRSLTARIGPTPTFTRASSGTVIGSDGLIQTVASGLPRFEHDPVTFQSLGMRIEESRTNSILQSGNIGGVTPWGTQNITVQVNTAIAPDGTMTANKLQETTQTNAQYITSQSTSFTTGTYVLSVFLKAAERTSAYFELGNAYLTANLSTGAITNSGQFGSGWTFVSSQSQNFGNGWYRFSIVATCTIAGTYPRCKLQIASGSSIAYAGVAGNGILVWGAQLETGSSVTTYIPTTTASAVRSADICSIGGTDFSGFYNPSEGTMVVSLIRGTTTGGTVNLSINSTANTNRADITSFNQSVELAYAAGGNFLYGLTMGNIAAGTPYRVAYAIAASNHAASMNGGTVQTNNTAIMLIGASRMNIGSNFNNVVTGTQIISSVRYYRRRLPNAKLQAITV